MFDLMNVQRIEAGLRPLEPDAALSAGARSHSEDMLRRQFFAHTERQTIGVGENIWMWSGQTVPPADAVAQQAIGDWMASPGHRANILRPGYTRLGIGVAIDATQVLVTAVFSE